MEQTETSEKRSAAVRRWRMKRVVDIKPSGEYVILEGVSYAIWRVLRSIRRVIHFID